MKCQNLFSGENKKKYFKMLSAENLPRVLKEIAGFHQQEN